MSISIANRNTTAQVAVSRLRRKVAASTHVYSGTLVCVNSTGYEVAAADSSGIIFDGYAESEADNSGGADGALSALVTPRPSLGCIECDAVSPDQSWILQEVAIADDHTVALLSQTSHVVRCGRVIDVTKTGTAGRVIVDTSDIAATNLGGS